MFCKWCGADIPNSATTCTRCGKKVPAMSDCGGFYDLVPGAKRNATAIPSPKPTPAKADPPRTDPAKIEPPKREDAPKGKKSNGRKFHGLSILITCIGFIMVMALLLGLNGKFDENLAALEQNNIDIAAISSELQQIKDSLETTPEEDTTPPTDNVTPEMPRLEEQNAIININVELGETGTSVKTSADLGDFDDAVTDMVTFGTENHSLTGVKIDLTAAQSCIEVTIENSVDFSYRRKGTLDAEFIVDKSVFAQADGDAEYEWKYRTESSAEWEALDEDIFTVSEDGAAVTYTVSELEDLFGEDREVIEFQLTYKRNNDKGGSLTVVISGIAVTKDSLEISSNLYN